MTDEVIFKPGREFSAIHIGLDLGLTAMDRADEAMNVWNRLTDAYPEPEYEGPVEASVGETGNGRPAAAQPAARGTGKGPWCPECGEVGKRYEVQQSTQKATGANAQFDIGFHPFPAGVTGPKGGKNHTIYARECVDRTGSFVYDRDNLPPGWKQAPQTSTPLPAGMPDEPDIDPDDLPF